MKALILNGGGLEKPYQEIVEKAEAWTRRQGALTVAFDLTSMNIKPCRGCFGCWVKTPGICFARDDMDRIMPHLAKSDWVFWVAPIAFGGYGYHLKKAADRSIPILLPFFVRPRRAARSRSGERAHLPRPCRTECHQHARPAGLDLAAAELSQDRPIPGEAVSLFARKLIPHWLYFLMANFGWRQQARKHAKTKREKIDLYARPYAE
jgi:multimeric flavodoxin WrbA